MADLRTLLQGFQFPQYYYQFIPLLSMLNHIKTSSTPAVSVLCLLPLMLDLLRLGVGLLLSPERRCEHQTSDWGRQREQRSKISRLKMGIG